MFLSEQFRMPAPIGDLVATLFYSPDGKRMLYNGRDIEPTHFIHPISLIWKDILGHEAQEGTSKKMFRKRNPSSLFWLILPGKYTVAVKRLRSLHLMAHKSVC
jgi:hypothetical protein